MSAGSENKVTAWLQGAKDALPVVVVLVGGWRALRLAPALSGFAAGQDAGPAPAVPAVPPEMLLKAPQAVVLDAQGVVAAVPRKEETLKMFFERLGGQK